MRISIFLACLILSHTHTFASDDVVPRYERLGVFFFFLEELKRTGSKLPVNRYEGALDGTQELFLVEGHLCMQNPSYSSPQKKRLWGDESDTQSDASDISSDEQTNDSGKTSHEISLDFDNETTKSTQQDTYTENQDPNSPPRKINRLGGKITDYFSSKR